MLGPKPVLSLKRGGRHARHAVAKARVDLVLRAVVGSGVEVATRARLTVAAHLLIPEQGLSESHRGIAVLDEAVEIPWVAPMDRLQRAGVSVFLFDEFSMRPPRIDAADPRSAPGFEALQCAHRKHELRARGPLRDATKRARRGAHRPMNTRSIGAALAQRATHATQSANIEINDVEVVRSQMYGAGRERGSPKAQTWSPRLIALVPRATAPPAREGQPPTPNLKGKPPTMVAVSLVGKCQPFT